MAPVGVEPMKCFILSVVRLILTFILCDSILMIQQHKHNHHKYQFLRHAVGIVFFKNHLWVASYGQGLYFYNYGKWRRRTDITPWISCLASNNKEIWIGTWMEGYIGVIKANGCYNVIHLPTILVPRGVYRVNCILLDKEKVWVGTDGYLLRYCKKKRDWDLMLSIGYISILTKQKDSIWIGTNSGLFRLIVLKNQFYLKEVISKINITALSIDNNILWIAGVDLKNKVCIFQYMLNSHQLQIININTSLPIVSILPYKSKILFLTGYSGFTSTNYPTNHKNNIIIVYDKKNEIFKYLQFKSKLKTINCTILLNHKLLIGGMGGIESFILPLH